MTRVMNTTELLKSSFGLVAPVTRKEFRRGYRARARELHPDMNKEDTTKEFQLLQETYEKLVGSNIFTDVIDSTVEGLNLSELGLGLGPLINGVECSHCCGNGYTSTFGFKYEYCNDCDDMGFPLPMKICPQCRGSKGFTSIKGHHVVCMTCNDRGKIKGHAKHQSLSEYWNLFEPRCPSCNGTKQRKVNDIEQMIYSRCSYCDGVGEIRIYNPVIMKARLNGGH